MGGSSGWRRLSAAQVLVFVVCGFGRPVRIAASCGSAFRPVPGHGERCAGAHSRNGRGRVWSGRSAASG
eukprot:5070713-Amphidinium_carterae.1